MPTFDFSNIIRLFLRAIFLVITNRIVILSFSVAAIYLAISQITGFFSEFIVNQDFNYQSFFDKISDFLQNDINQVIFYSFALDKLLSLVSIMISSLKYIFSVILAIPLALFSQSIIAKYRTSFLKTIESLKA